MSTIDGKLGWKLSRTAAARVLNPLPVPTECPYCQGEVKAVRNEEIYGRAFGPWPYSYLCVGCRAYVGMHPQTNIPLGTLADAATRNARKIAKERFQSYLIGRCCMSRNEAYEWLARKLGIAVSACHFGWFNIEACRNVVKAINDDANRLHARHPIPPAIREFVRSARG